MNLKDEKIINKRFNKLLELIQKNDGAENFFKKLGINSTHFSKRCGMARSNLINTLNRIKRNGEYGRESHIDTKERILIAFSTLVGEILISYEFIFKPTK